MGSIRKGRNECHHKEQTSIINEGMRSKNKGRSRLKELFDFPSKFRNDREGVISGVEGLATSSERSIDIVRKTS